MKYSWQINNYDSDRDILDTGILVHMGDSTIIKFKDISDLEDFANGILHSLPEIKENIQITNDPAMQILFASPVILRRISQLHEPTLFNPNRTANRANKRGAPRV